MTMSSGYCSLDEDLEDCFFTAKTSFFRSAQSKVPAKVTQRCRTFGCGRCQKGAGAGLGAELRAGRGFCPLLCGVCTAAGFSEPFQAGFPRSEGIHAGSPWGFSALGEILQQPRVRDLWFGHEKLHLCGGWESSGQD